MRVGNLDFDEVSVVDFEFKINAGENPDPVCMVAQEVVSGREWRLWASDLHALKEAPFPVGKGSLVVAYFASAETGCFMELGWPRPAHVLDLFTEFRNQTNGLFLPSGAGLLGATTAYGIANIGEVEKNVMRDLIISRTSWTPDEQSEIVAYCSSDVEATAALLKSMAGSIDIERALLRGQYMVASAAMERAGVPIDMATLTRLRENWAEIKLRLIARIDQRYGVFEDATFKSERFVAWLAREGIPWPTLPSGRPALDDDTFRQMSRLHPVIAPLRELRYSLSQLRLADLAVGHDGRNRTLLSPFRARTGRNQPSNAHFIFGPSVWARGLIKPPPGYAVVYLDYEQQEFGIAAALSSDKQMLAAYTSGDPYLAFAVQAGAAPPGATKASHKTVREQFKQCALATQYGMGAASLATKLNLSRAGANELLHLHRRTYPTFWKWSDAAVDHAILKGELWTVFDWRIHVGPNVNPRSLRNFPVQANGAEILRLACTLAIERGARVVAPVHDALLIEAPLVALDTAITIAKTSMIEASGIVLGGFELRVETQVVKYPERYSDPRGKLMWDTVMSTLDEIGTSAETA